MMDQDPVCVREARRQPVFAEDGEVNGNGTLPNVFVYVKSGAEKYTFATPSDARRRSIRTAACTSRTCWASWWDRR